MLLIPWSPSAQSVIHRHSCVSIFIRWEGNATTRNIIRGLARTGLTPALALAVLAAPAVLFAQKNPTAVKFESPALKKIIAISSRFYLPKTDIGNSRWVRRTCVALMQSVPTNHKEPRTYHSECLSETPAECVGSARELIVVILCSSAVLMCNAEPPHPPNSGLVSLSSIFPFFILG